MLMLLNGYDADTKGFYLTNSTCLGVYVATCANTYFPTKQRSGIVHIYRLLLRCCPDNQAI